MNNLSFGIDISKHQYSQDGSRKPNFDLINQTCSFVGVRAGISWGYTDPWFSYSWEHIACPRLAYHVTYPGEDTNRQMDHFLRIVNPGEHDRLVLDLELDHGFSKARITQTVNACLERLKAETGRYPVIYSRASWVDAFLEVADLPVVDWWLANYLKRQPFPLYTPEKDSPPLMPTGVNSWLIHQTGERSNGGAVGVVSYYVDTDRWNGTEADMLDYFGLEEQPDPEPPADVLFDAKVTATAGLRIRSGAGTNYAKIGVLAYQEVVSVYEAVPGWYRHSRGGWSSSEYLEPLGGDPPEMLTPYYGALYWQRDPRWKDKPLGTSGTIGSYGCTMTAETNVLNQLGIVTNPVVNNAWRTANGGYRNGNLIVWEKVTEQHPNIIWEGKTWNPTDAQIKQKIADGCPLVMLVDHNEGTPALDEHWVNSIPSPADDDAIWIHDPWDNLTIRLRDRYKKPIQQFSSYRRAL